MSRHLKVIGLVCFLSLFLVTLLAQAQEGKPDRNDVLLKATFRDAPGDAIRSENGLPYVNGTYLFAYIKNPEGELRFCVLERSGRRVVFRFPRENRVRPPYDPNNPGYVDISKYCFYCQGESVNPPDTEVLEPAIETHVHTYVASWSQPNYNLLLMAHNQVERIEANMFLFSTYQRGKFQLYLNDSLCLAERRGRCFWVKSTDENGDGQVDRWQITPWNPANPADPYYTGYANLYGYLEKKNKGVSVRCEYGDFWMPFVLTLDRVK
jgi:hypothetical protein